MLVFYFLCDNIFHVNVPHRYPNIYERKRDWLRAASAVRRIHENYVVPLELPEANLALICKCSDNVARNSHGIFCDSIKKKQAFCIASNLFYQTTSKIEILTTEH